MGAKKLEPQVENFRSERLVVEKHKEPLIDYRDLMFICQIIISSFATRELVLSSFFTFNNVWQKIVTVAFCVVVFTMIQYRLCTSMVKSQA